MTGLVTDSVTGSVASSVAGSAAILQFAALPRGTRSWIYGYAEGALGQHARTLPAESRSELEVNPVAIPNQSQISHVVVHLYHQAPAGARQIGFAPCRR